MTERRIQIPALAGFRAYSILGVVAFHMLVLSAPPAEQGILTLAEWIAVGGLLDTFFLVSGCGLFLPIVARGGLGGAGSFLRSRAVRLLPGLWLVLTLTLVLIAATSAAFPGPGEIALQYGVAAWPARLFDVSLPIGFGNGALWMVSVIVGFYVLLAAFAGAYLRHPLIGLAIAAAVTVAWKLAAMHLTGAFTFLEGSDSNAWLVSATVVDQLPGWTFAFALGMTGAWAYVNHVLPRPREELERLALRIAPVAIVCFAACSYLYATLAFEAPGSGGAIARSSPFLGLAFTLSRAALIAVVVIGPVVLARPFANAFATKLAELSYGIYLIHVVVATYLVSMLLGLPADGSLATAALWFAVVVPVSALFAYLSLRFVERPAIAWYRARSRRGAAGDEVSPRRAVTPERPPLAAAR